jgi:hypothetical protein
MVLSIRTSSGSQASKGRRARRSAGVLQGTVPIPEKGRISALVPTAVVYSRADDVYVKAYREKPRVVKKKARFLRHWDRWDV